MGAVGLHGGTACENTGRLVDLLARKNAGGCCATICATDDAGAPGVTAVADRRACMVDGGSGQSNFIENVETGDARFILADAGVVEEYPCELATEHELRRAHPAMRSGHDNGAGVFWSENSYRVGHKDGMRSQ